MRPPGNGSDALSGPLSTSSLDYMQGHSRGAATDSCLPPVSSPFLDLLRRPIASPLLRNYSF